MADIKITEKPLVTQLTSDASVFIAQTLSGGSEPALRRISTGNLKAGLDIAELPEATTADNGKFLGVENGSWSKVTLGSVFKLKGSKATVSDLPATGNEIGDVWYVQSEHVGYIWINDASTNRWEQLGPSIDLSACEQVSNKSTSLTSSSTNTQYPTAKAVFDYINDNLETWTFTLEDDTTVTKKVLVL